ncbi:NEAT domain-containing protein [Siminovitchia sp. FSL H7-0308]|uniref:NEAT domain-containing protein n=1 Tax=Siminovitchia sp. FSL H7-0308 TaxID=2921432 RepID=UPI0030ED9E1D
MKKFILTALSFLLIFFTAMPSLQPHAAKANSKYAVGEYDLPFTILKDTSDEPSMTNDYIKSPAKLIVEQNGEMHVVMTLNNSSWWQYLKVQTTQPGSFQDNNFVDATVISEDKASDTRVVTFKVQDIEQVLNAKIHVIVPMIHYDNKYDIRFQFDASGIPLAPEPEPEPEIIADGEYTIGFRALHAEEEKDSAMGRYIDQPATLSVNNGKKQIKFVLKDHQAITGFQVEKDGQYVDATVVSVNEEANTRVVAFDVERLDSIIHSKVQVHVPAQNYTGNHIVRLSFDKGSMKVKPKEDENEEKPGEENPSEEQPGEEQPGEEQPGEEKPGEEKPGEEQPGEEQPGEEQPGEEQPGEEKPGAPNPDTEKIDPRNLKDGEYSIDYSVLKKESDELSMMNDYVVKPGSLKVKDGKKYLAVTLKKSSWITEFKVEKDGKLMAPKLLQSDEEADTRTVEFEVADLSSLLNAWVKVDIPELHYHNEYDIRFSFDTDSIKLLKEGVYPKEDNNATLPPKSNDQKPKANDKNDRLNFDRNGDKTGKSIDQPQLKADQKGMNPKTADTTKMLLFALLFVLSLVPLIARFRSRRHLQ